MFRYYLSMKILKVAFAALLFFTVIYGLQWTLHSFSSKPANSTYGTESANNIESNLHHFLTDPVYPRLMQSCVLAYNNEFRRLNPDAKDLADLITIENFSENELIITNPNTGQKKVNLANINIINEFFNVLDSPMSDHKMIKQCLLDDGYSLKDMQRISKKFSKFANSN